MKKEIKKVAIIGAIVMLVMFIFGGCGEDPVVKVRVKGYLTQPTGSGRETHLTWVDVLEVYDADKFRSTADKISEDGKRANLQQRYQYKEDGYALMSKDNSYFVYYGDRYLYPKKKSYIIENILCWLILTFGIYFLPKAIRKMEV